MFKCVRCYLYNCFGKIDYKGGIWSYGGHHDSDNWGAFSNYYHRTVTHWSEVVRHRDSKAKNVTALLGNTSKAFINTFWGEHVSFGAGHGYGK
ncbi:lactococcin 972 family bacteriocin [Granulicatella sp. WM01]|nr:lactococcin 972 family bacteriocin [Granulicatella sp. WM01]